MPLSFALLSAEAPDPTRLDELLAALGEAELLVVCEGSLLPLLARRLTLVRPLAGRGAIARLHAALLAGRGEALVAIDGDAPLPSPELLRGLAAHPARGNLLLLESEGALPGRYRRGCLRALRAAITRGEEDLPGLVAALPATVADSQSLLQSIGLPSRKRRARRSSTTPQARSK